MGGGHKAEVFHLGDKGQARRVRAARGLRPQPPQSSQAEEILWIKCQGFTRVISLLASPHNLHAYDEEKLPWSHIPFAGNDDPAGAPRPL